MTDSIDLNADLGEGFGAYRLGDDTAMLEIVSSVNVACGFHAGDPCIMNRTVAQAQARGIAVGAHPSFLDLQGFGRRRVLGLSEAELRHLVLYQIGALSAIAQTQGCRLRHVRAHGALGNMSDEQPEMAQTLAQAVFDLDPSLALMTLPNSAAEHAAKALGLNVVRQLFADRAYTADGQLLSRAKAGAVIHDADFAAERIVRALHEGVIESVDQTRIPIEFDTVVVHGDTPSAVQMAERIRHKLEQEGLSVRAFHHD